MKRDLWNRFMITLMGALIVFGAQQIWTSPAPLSEFRYMLSISIAALVIVLKVRELRRVEKKPESGV
ncbi:MAG TPA: hypothetical protein VGX03_33855 [Candidatus Binatia bacterium]|jgi:hypothetical protein|nr:hypothetical protein [Candidatus Binatia bacterium]